MQSLRDWDFNKHTSEHKKNPDGVQYLWKQNGLNFPTTPKELNHSPAENEPSTESVIISDF